jgi:hypothetical protein
VWGNSNLNPLSLSSLKPYRELKEKVLSVEQVAQSHLHTLQSPYFTGISTVQYSTYIEHQQASIQDSCQKMIQKIQQLKLDLEHLKTFLVKRPSKEPSTMMSWAALTSQKKHLEKQLATLQQDKISELCAIFRLRKVRVTTKRHSREEFRILHMGMPSLAQISFTAHSKLVPLFSHVSQMMTLIARILHVQLPFHMQQVCSKPLFKHPVTGEIHRLYLMDGVPKEEFFTALVMMNYNLCTLLNHRGMNVSLESSIDTLTNLILLYRGSERENQEGNSLLDFKAMKDYCLSMSEHPNHASSVKESTEELLDEWELF